MTLSALTGCGTKAGSTSDGTSSADDGTVTLKGIAAAVPHAELIKLIEPDLEKEGVKIDLVSTAPDSSTNAKLASGEIGFNFFPA